MAITDMKDVKKLQKRLKSALDELKYIKKCCEDAGRELEKNSFKWDSKEKNLVIQALQLNEKFEHKEQECEKYKKAFDSIVATIKDLEKEDIVTFPDFSLKENCKIIIGQCNKGYVDILNIIKKAKDV